MSTADQAVNPSQTLKRLLWMLGVWIGVLVAVFGGAELSLRLFRFPVGPSQGMEHIMRVAGLPALNDCLLDDPILFWKLKPGLNNQHVSGQVIGHPIDFHITTDDSGLRKMPPPHAEPDTARILAIGDSCTFGFGVDDNEAWPYQLQQMLDTQSNGKHIQVINAGVPAYSSYQILQYLRTSGLSLKPNLVLLQTWMNDRNSWGWGDYNIASQLHPSPTRQLLLKSSLYGLLMRGMATLNTPDRPRLFHNEFLHTLADIVETCKDNNLPLLFVLWPDEESFRKGRLEPYAAAFKQAAKDHNKPCVDVLPAILNKPGPWFIDPCHATPQGNTVTAQLLLPEVLGILK